MDLIQISAKDSTHISAVHRIAAINRIFPNLRGIYCDDGHGETQLELLWAMGREAARMLLALIDGKAAPAQVVLPVELIVRGSSDRPAAGRRAKALPGKVDAPEPGSGRIRSDGEIGGSTVG